MSQKVLITGAHGFIGRHVAVQLSRDGYTVDGIGHGEWSPAEQTDWGISKWNRSDVTLETLRQCARAPDVLVHCAGSGSVPASIANPYQDFERTVVTTAAVLEFVRTDSPSTKIVFPSSASVYGKVQVSPIAEEDPLAPISPYGVHKKIAEELFLSYVAQYDLSVSILRLFSIYGCGLQKQLLWDACEKMKKGYYVFGGTGEEVRDWLNVYDAARLISALAGSTVSGVRILNGGTGTGVRVRDVLAQVSESLGIPGSKIAFSGNTRAGDPSVYVADTSRVSELGWMPRVNWKQGVADYAIWWKEHVSRGV
jgi:UDP-glucose 4-epimerase